MEPNDRKWEKCSNTDHANDVKNRCCSCRLFCCYGFFLQAFHIFPAGDSTAKARFKAIFFMMGAICFLLEAATEKDWRFGGGSPMPSWLGQTLCVLFGVILLATAVDALLEKGN
jgi:hypothetical protein